MVAIRFIHREEATRYHVQHLLQLGIGFVIITRLVTLSLGLRHLRRGQAKNKDVLQAHFFHDLDVGAIQCAYGERAVERHFHVAGATGFGAGRGDLLGQIATWE